jgi:hypothetical protein
MLQSLLANIDRLRGRYGIQVLFAKKYYAKKTSKSRGAIESATR